MIYDLYFHNDFDGWASAAVMLSFFEGRGDRVGHFVPVDHDLQPQWVKDDFFAKHRLFKGKRNAPVVLDFPFHPGTAFWFDHHPTPFKKESWEKTFREDKAHAYRPSYASCCHATYAALKRNFKWNPPAHFKELTVWLDAVDGARYVSARQTILMKEPVFAVDNFLDRQGGDPKKAEWLIRLLATRSLDDIAKIPEIAAVGRSVQKKAIQNLSFYKTHLVVMGNTSVIDLVRNGDKVLRFAPYYLFPKLRYGIRAAMKGKFFHLGVGANPWLKDRSLKKGVHIGKLLKKYGGGGHHDAGGVEFVTKEDADRAQAEIIKILNKG